MITRNEFWAAVLLFLLCMVMVRVLFDPSLREGAGQPAPKPAPQRTEVLDSENPKQGPLAWAIDKIERLNDSLGEAHARIESQRMRINELEKRLDWLEQRIKETR